jgi:hypothetical protein
MIITKDTWVKVALAGCVVIKQSVYTLDLCFKDDEPTDADETFALKHNEPLQFPKMEFDLWARARKENVRVIVEKIATF